MSELEVRYRRILSRIKPNVNLLAVSKTRSVLEIQTLQNLGQVHFGENKVQELVQKAGELEKSKIQWHFIGSLQSNKINQLLRVKNLEYIHSIDSLGLLEKLLRKDPLKRLKLFLQINTSGENEKAGFNLNSIKDLDRAIEILNGQKNFELYGLMTIGKIRTVNFKEDAKNSFQILRELKSELDIRHNLNLQLSMGMSQDLEIAQDIGTNWVRVGTEIFGSRV